MHRETRFVKFLTISSCWSIRSTNTRRLKQSELGFEGKRILTVNCPSNLSRSTCNFINLSSAFTSLSDSYNIQYRDTWIKTRFTCVQASPGAFPMLSTLLKKMLVVEGAQAHSLPISSFSPCASAPNSSLRSIQMFLEIKLYLKDSFGNFTAGMINMNLQSSIPMPDETESNDCNAHTFWRSSNNLVFSSIASVNFSCNSFLSFSSFSAFSLAFLS